MATPVVRRTTREHTRERSRMSFTGSAEDGIGILRDPVYEARVKAWLGDPKKLLDWRYTMARCQALADMLEDRVRRGGDSGTVPPALLAAVGELRQLHGVIAKLEGQIDTTTHVHVSLVNALVVNATNVLTEFVPPDRLGAALDKLYAMQERAVPGATKPGEAAVDP